MRFPTPDPIRAEKYYRRDDWRHETVPGLIAAAITATPDKIALRDASGATLTYRELDERAGRLAGFLHDRGVGKGDVVTVSLPNWWQTAVSFLAIMRLGAVVNPVPTTYGRADLSYVLEKCNSAAVIVAARFRSADFTRTLRDISPALADEIIVLRIGTGEVDIGIEFDVALASPEFESDSEISGDDIAAILFTSGTESKSKGAVHSHNTILFGERSLAGVLGLGAADVAFMASPISHTTGFMHGFVMTLMTGGTLSLLDVFSGSTAVSQMQEHRCTWTMGATPFLADTTAVLEETGARLPDLRYFLSGGAPIPEVLVRRAQEVDLRVLAVYGATESPPHTVVWPEDPIENSWQTDGRALPGIEIRIVDPAGTDVAVGETGEEWSRGPNVFLGYLGEPELTRKALDADGWYHSGDLARAFPDGSIRIVGRIKEMLVRGGQNISVREVEDYIIAHPAVVSVAVIGVPHDRLGETACAVVVTRPGQSIALPELSEFLIDRGIARFKLPERLEVWSSLPTTPSGKIQKFLIKQRLRDEPGRKES